jgi:hypothetical protein
MDVAVVHDAFRLPARHRWLLAYRSVDVLFMQAAETELNRTRKPLCCKVTRQRANSSATPHDRGHAFAHFTAHSRLCRANVQLDRSPRLKAGDSWADRCATIGGK